MDTLDPKRATGLFLVQTDDKHAYLVGCAARVSGLVRVASTHEEIHGLMVVNWCSEHDAYRPIAVGEIQCLSLQGQMARAKHTATVISIDPVPGATMISDTFVIRGVDPISMQALGVIKNQPRRMRRRRRIMP